MKSFIQKYEQDVMGALSGFDRLVFRGTLRRKVKRLQIPPPRGKCLHLYHYFFHPQCGFMSARLQTWFPPDHPGAANGFRNRDLMKLLYASDRELTAIEKRRQSRAITRKLLLLRAHGLIKQVPQTRRYHLTASRSKAITAVIAALHASSDSFIK